MAEIFFIADLHFGHKKIVEYEPKRKSIGLTIEEHDQAVIDRCNKVVSKKDTLWILGDLAFNREALKKVSSLNGTKKVIGGNHDVYSAKTYLHYVNQIYGAFVLEEFLLTHIPVHDSQKRRFKGNIHGHLHDQVIPDWFYFNVSCERVNFTPISFDEIKKRYG